MVFKIKRLIILFIVFFAYNCASVKLSETANTTNFAIEELEKIVKAKNTTPEQRQAAKLGIAQLKDKKQTDRTNQVLNKQVISKSENSGAGKLSFYFLGVLALAIIAVIIIYIKRFLP